MRRLSTRTVGDVPVSYLAFHKVASALKFQPLLMLAGVSILCIHGLATLSFAQIDTEEQLNAVNGGGVATEDTTLAGTNFPALGNRACGLFGCDANGNPIQAPAGSGNSSGDSGNAAFPQSDENQICGFGVGGVRGFNCIPRTQGDSSGSGALQGPNPDDSVFGFSGNGSLQGANPEGSVFGSPDIGSLQGPNPDGSVFGSIPSTGPSGTSLGGGISFGPGSGAAVPLSDAGIRAAVCQLLGLIEGSFGALIMVVAGILAIVSATMGGYRSGVNLIYIGAGAFILRSLVSLFFGDVGC